MRILVFNWRDINHPDSGGAEVHLQEICKRLVARGHQVKLVCSRYRNCQIQETIDGVEIVRTGTWYSFPMAALYYYLFKARQERFDLVVDDISKTPLFSPLFVRKPLIGLWHMRHGSSLFKQAPFLLALIVMVLEYLIPFIYRTKTMVVVSESTKRELRRFGFPEKRIHVVYNGANLPPSNSSPKVELPTVVYLGRLRQYKQIDHLIRAFRIVKDRLQEARLTIAGRGDDQPRLMKLAEGMGLSNSTDFRGSVAEEEKLEILRRSWVYAIASLREGWGISVIEANSCGTPAIGYDVPGLRDSIRHGETGYLVRRGDIPALAAAILQVLGDAQLRERLGKNALSFAQQFTWDRAADEFLKVLEKVLPSRDSRG